MTLLGTMIIVVIFTVIVLGAVAGAQHLENQGPEGHEGSRRG